MRRLTKAEVDTLYEIVYRSFEDGSYVAPKSQYYARVQRLLDWIRELPYPGKQK